MMHLLSFLLSLTTALTANAAPMKRASPTLYLVGDSTMALHKDSEGIQGWGVELPQYLTGITVVNSATSGRSARSYTREGRWAAVQALLKPGDFVIMEMGHNDGGSPDTSDRADLFGDSLTATQTVTLADGTKEVVHTFPYYIQSWITGALAKGATPIVSSQTPNNPFESSNTVNTTPTRFVTYAQSSASAKGVPYVDHFLATNSIYAKLGATTVRGYYPFDHTHTNVAGANQVAWAFLSGLRCPSAKSALAPHINSVGQGASALC